MHERSLLGARGEDEALRFFEQKGGRLLTRNWSCRWGEIDLLVDLAGVLHVIEVKTRASSRESPFEAISPKKRERLERAFVAWCAAMNHHPDKTPHQYDAFLLWREQGIWKTAWVEGI